MTIFSEIPRGSWLEIDLSAVAHNAREIRRIVPANVKIMAIVKGNGYGSGYEEIATTVLANGVSALAVATMGEAIYLRSAHVQAPILVLSWIPPEHGELVINNNITQTIYNYESAKILSDFAVKLGKTATVHLKIDTGMGRLGFLPNAVSLEEISKIMALPNLFVEGLYSHFATSDSSDKAYAHYQFERFMAFSQGIEQDGFQIPLKHIANSGAVLDLPETYLDMVRSGILFSGIYPSPEVRKDVVKLMPCTALKARLCEVKVVPAGTKIGYGCTYETTRESTIGCLPVGYVDGYNFNLSNKGYVLLHGTKAPIIGTVCMDQLMIDLTDIPQVHIGDEAVLIGSQGQLSITMEELAVLAQVPAHELMSNLSFRLPRVYLKEGKLSVPHGDSLMLL